MISEFFWEFLKYKVRHFAREYSINPSSPEDTIWRTQLLAPYSGYPHMVPLHSCSESRIPPYGAPYFTAKNNHLQFDWLIFITANNSLIVYLSFDV